MVKSSGIVVVVVVVTIVLLKPLSILYGINFYKL